MEPQLPAGLKQPLTVILHLRQARHRHHQMGQARVAQLHIGRPQRAAVRALGGPAGAQHRGPVQQHLVQPVGLPPGGHVAAGGLNDDLVLGGEMLVYEPAEAPGPVAAHLPHAAVAVEEPHLRVAAVLGLVGHHQAVRPHAGAPGAYLARQQGHLFRGQAGDPVVDHHKIIARALHLAEFQFHGLSSFLCCLSEQTGCSTDSRRTRSAPAARRVCPVPPHGRPA